jgi:hypothetical protein
MARSPKSILTFGVSWKTEPEFDQKAPFGEKFYRMTIVLSYEAAQ